MDTDNNNPVTDMFLGYGVHEWSEAVIIIGFLAGCIATLTKLFIRNEFKTLIDQQQQHTTNIQLVLKDLTNLSTRLAHLEELPERVSAIEVELYKAMATLASKEELYKHAENTSQAILRIHDRIDRIGEKIQ